MLNVEAALEEIIKNVSPAPPNLLSLQDALGCLLAEALISQENSPPFDKSMMDGYAVRVDDLQPGEQNSSTFELHVIGEVTAGRQTDQSVSSGTAIRIMTGAPIPNGASAVVPVELSTLDGEEVSLQIDRVVENGWNIITCGQNIAAGETVLRQGKQIRPQEVALLAELGCAKVSVRRPPTIAILATGDELVEIDQIPGPGQIRNSNATMLAAQVTAAGAIPVIIPVARDNREDLKSKILRGLESDFLCLSGGVSAGKLDLVPSELATAGVEQIFHKVAMKPGKPIWFGKRSASASQSECVVFGLPGNPISSMICFELFVKTALRRFSGFTNPYPPLIDAKLQTDFNQRGEREVWYPSFAEIEHGQVVVTPTNWKGSSDILSTTQANCSVRFPAGEKIFRAGEFVQILLWSGSQLASKLAANS